LQILPTVEDYAAEGGWDVVRQTITVTGIAALFGFVCIFPIQARGAAQPVYRDSFSVDKANLADTGRNAYFILEPGYRLVFQSGQDTLIITVLGETRMVDGVSTRIIEERETSGGQLAEVSRNFFAIDRTTRGVYYFGEEVDEYRKGKVVGHGGSWLAGVNGARFGLMMPDAPKVGDRFYQEVAPRVAMDRAEVVSITDQITVPAGTFKGCVRAKESTPLETGTEEKWFAPDVGLVKDAEFVLVRIERGPRERNPASGASSAREMCASASGLQRARRQWPSRRERQPREPPGYRPSPPASGATHAKFAASSTLPEPL
jgi:hypothetical protein